MNTVAVRLPPKTYTFVRLPSTATTGVFHQPLGTAVELKSINGVAVVGPWAALPPDEFYQYYSKVGSNEYGLSVDFTDESGAVLHFDTLPVRHFGQPSGNYAVPAGGNFTNGTTGWNFPNGTKIAFTYTNGYLSSVANNFGRSLNFTYSSVCCFLTEPGGAGVFNHSVAAPGYGTALLTKVTDENGRSVSFALSNCPSGSSIQPGGGTPPISTTKLYACNTLSVTLPDGSVEKYDYTPGAYSPDPSIIERPSFKLRRVYLPSDLTTAFQTFSYDQMFRLSSVKDMLGRQTSYYQSALANEYYKRGEVVDPLSNSSTALFDQWNSETQAADPLLRVTTKTYDVARRLVLQGNPGTNCQAYGYDVRGNVVSTNKYPNGSCTVTGNIVALNGSPGTPIVTSATYMEGVGVYPCANVLTCNEPVTQTDALGKVTASSWNTNGQLHSVIKPADANGSQPETDYTYGITNGISFLTQKADWISRSPVKSVTTSYTYNSANKYVLATSTLDSGSGGLALRTCFKFDAIGNLISTTDPRGATCP